MLMAGHVCGSGGTPAGPKLERAPCLANTRRGRLWGSLPVFATQPGTRYPLRKRTVRPSSGPGDLTEGALKRPTTRSDAPTPDPVPDRCSAQPRTHVSLSRLAALARWGCHLFGRHGDGDPRCAHGPPSPLASRSRDRGGTSWSWGLSAAEVDDVEL